MKSLYVFGFILTERFNQERDVDLIVDFAPMAIEQYADNYFNLKYSLQTILNRRIDLLEESSLKNFSSRNLYINNGNSFLHNEKLIWLHDILNAIFEIESFTT